MKSICCALLVPVLSLSLLAPRAEAKESFSKATGLFWPVLQRGSQGEVVRALQFLLRSKGYSVATNGQFGPVTQSKLRQFQTQKNLVVDGVLGAQSWEALTPNLQQGSSGNAVRALQTLLKLRGQNVVRDGIFGAVTKQKVKNFQQSVSIIGNDGKVRHTQWCYLAGGHLDGE